MADLRGDRIAINNTETNTVSQSVSLDQASGCDHDDIIVNLCTCMYRAEHSLSVKLLTGKIICVYK